MNESSPEKVSPEFDLEGLVENSQAERMKEIILGEMMKTAGLKQEKAEHVEEQQGWQVNLRGNLKFGNHTVSHKQL